MKVFDPKAQSHRVRCGKPPERPAHWPKKATAFAREHGLEVKGVLEMLDHLADLLEWEGASRQDAEHYAWEQMLDIMAPRRRVA